MRGPYGGYRVGRGLRMPLLVFTATEALGLVMAVLDGHHNAGDPTDPVGGALGKIVRALPERVAAQAEVVRRSTAPAPDRAAVRPDPETTSALVQACSDQRRVRFGYRSEAGSEWVAEVDPWALVVRHGRWYLLCYSHGADARRAYRVDRVREVQVLDDTFTSPADLDRRAARGAPGRGLGVRRGSRHRRTPRHRGVVRPRSLDASSPSMPRRPAWLGALATRPGYAEQLAAVPASYRIVQCPELRDAARVIGQRLLKAAGDT